MVTVLLAVIAIIGGVVAWSRYSPGPPLEITITPQPAPAGMICIDGAITNPGFYPFTSGDTLQDLIGAAGGVTASANLSGLKLSFPELGNQQELQKIDINRADVWLLEALPGIGPTLARRIVAYRQQNGPFRNTAELTKVASIGTATLERIKHLITVAD